ncbi:MAG: sarcosine oxidase subunit gamma family protein [Pseudomonadota bacterium]
MGTDATATGPLAVRPLDGHRDRLAAAGGPDIRLEIIEPKAILNLRGRAGDPSFVDAIRTALGLDLPTEPNRCRSTTTEGDGAVQTIYWLGPDEWLVIAAAGTEAPLEAALRAARPEDPWLSIVDVSHNSTGLRLGGTSARDVLASGCPLDVHPRVFDVDHCAQTMLAKSRILLRQVSVEPAFEIWVRNSFARYLAGWLMDAMALRDPAA